MIAFETTAAAPQAARPTHDGTIWPRARAAMSDPAQIVARMAQDMNRGLAERQSVSDEDLGLLGWDDAQVATYRTRALSAAKRACRPEAAALAECIGHTVASGVAALAVVGMVACLCWASDHRPSRVTGAGAAPHISARA